MWPSYQHAGKYVPYVQELFATFVYSVYLNNCFCHVCAEIHMACEKCSDYSIFICLGVLTTVLLASRGFQACNVAMCYDHYE